MQPISFLVCVAHPTQTPFIAAQIHNPPREAPSPQPLPSRHQHKSCAFLFSHTQVYPLEMESSWVSASRKTRSRSSSRKTSSRVNGSRKMRLIHFHTKALSAPSHQIRSRLRASPAKSCLLHRLPRLRARFPRLCTHCPRLGACVCFGAAYGHERGVTAPHHA
jgi:hypothetical protein